MTERIASAQRPEEATAGSGSVKLETRIALNNILLSTDFSRSADAAVPYALEIADKSLTDAVRSNPGLMAGVNTYKGKVTCEPVAKSQNREFTPVEELL